MRYIILFFILIICSSSFSIVNDSIESTIIKALSEAEDSVNIYTELLSSKEITDKLNALSLSGVNVQIILPGSSLKKSFSLHWKLDEKICLCTINDSMYRKPDFIIIDNAKALTGSFSLQPEKYNGKCFLFRHDSKDGLKQMHTLFNSLLSQSEFYDLRIQKITIEEFGVAPELNVGKFCIVSGMVSEIRNSKDMKTYFIKFANDKTDFTIVIFKSVSDALFKADINPLYWKGKYMSFRGLIINHEKYGYEILLNSIEDVIEL